MWVVLKMGPLKIIRFNDIFGFKIPRMQCNVSKLVSKDSANIFWKKWTICNRAFSNFSCIIFVNLNYNCCHLLDLRNLQEQVKKAFCYEKLFWPFTVWINCSSDREKLLKFEAEGREFSKILRSLEQFIQTVKGQNNFS